MSPLVQEVALEAAEIAIRYIASKLSGSSRQNEAAEVAAIKIQSRARLRAGAQAKLDKRKKKS